MTASAQATSGDGSAAGDGRPPADAVTTPADPIAEGTRLFGDGDWAGAYARFDDAYRVTADYRPLHAMALCRCMLGDFAAAAELFDRFVQEGGTMVPVEQAGRVTAFAATLRSRGMPDGFDGPPRDPAECMPPAGASAADEPAAPPLPPESVSMQDLSNDLRVVLRTAVGFSEHGITDDGPMGTTMFLDLSGTFPLIDGLRAGLQVPAWFEIPEHAHLGGLSLWLQAVFNGTGAVRFGALLRGYVPTAVPNSSGWMPFMSPHEPYPAWTMRTYHGGIEGRVAVGWTSDEGFFQAELIGGAVVSDRYDTDGYGFAALAGGWRMLPSLSLLFELTHLGWPILGMAGLAGLTYHGDIGLAGLAVGSTFWGVPWIVAWGGVHF